MTFLVLLFWLLFPEVNSSPYVSDSFVMYSSDRPTPDKCIPIPKNFTLCYGMQYKTMRLPNLLDHDTLDEVIEQAEPWPVLTNLNCHPDAQLFLCSLFAPVCLAALDREILPCRSLCEAVQKGCELRMIQYGFPWPDILSCKKFPQDNDMCIKVVAGKRQRGIARTCSACNQVGTYENILDHYCHSQYVMKTKVRSIKQMVLTLRKVRSLKEKELGHGSHRRTLSRREEVLISSKDQKCVCPVASRKKENRFLIMANLTSDNQLIANLILPWNREDKAFKRAIKKFDKLNCKNLGRSIRQRAIKHSLNLRLHSDGMKRYRNP